MIRGSAEAESTVLRSRYGGGKNPDEQVAKNTQQANVHLKRIGDELAKLAAPTHVGTYSLKAKG
jgi:hypothetical protein